MNSMHELYADEKEQKEEMIIKSKGGLLVMDKCKWYNTEAELCDIPNRFVEQCVNQEKPELCGCYEEVKDHEYDT